MYQQERLDKILKILKNIHYSTVDYLVEQIHYSPASIRRDLSLLEKQGLVKRSYGGVEIIEENVAPFKFRQHSMKSEKNKIAASAAEQSGRGTIPQVVVLGSYAEALKRATAADKAVLFYENERATTFRMALDAGSFETISLLTGPEGGLDEREVEQAKNAGMDICTLGKRILRCETAPLCALSALMYHCGEF